MYTPVILETMENVYTPGKPETRKNLNTPVAEFKEFERRFKFKPRFKYGWFHLNQMFQDLSRR